MQQHYKTNEYSVRFLSIKIQPAFFLQELSSVWLAQLVKALAAPIHVRSCVQEVQTRRGQARDSGFHPSGLGKMRSS